MSWKRFRAAWHRGGARLALRVAADRTHGRWFDARYGVDTAGLIPIECLIAEWRGLHDYFPTSFRAFHRLMRHIEIRSQHDVFVDFGSGKGRVLLMAAQYPFKRIMGVEISEQLNRTARSNVDRWSGLVACPHIDIITADAARFKIPIDATVLYFYNPFRESTLRAVFRAIAASAERYPRTIWVVFNNTAHFRALEPELPWLRARARPMFEHDCGIYLAEPAAPVVRT